jgi:hypothetical protein
MLQPGASAEELAVGEISGYSGERVRGGAFPGQPDNLRVRVAGVLQPVAERADRRAQKRGRPTLEERLNAADLKMRPQEFIMIRIGALLAAALLGLVRFGPSWQLLVLAAAGYAVPGIWLRFRRRRRLNRFNDQLADVLLLLRNSVRAGQSFPQAIGNLPRSSSRGWRGRCSSEARSTTVSATW